MSDAYASALWVIGHLFKVALGGGVGVVVAARPEYYGARLFTMAGTGSLLDTTVRAGSLNVTACSVQACTGERRCVIVNKEPGSALRVSLATPWALGSATAILMTGPALSSTTGMQLQGATIAIDGSLMTGAAYELPVAGGQVTVYLEPLSAALITIAGGGTRAACALRARPRRRTRRPPAARAMAA